MKSIRIQPLLHPIEAEVLIPGSKSYTNRALIMAAMTKDSVKIINPLLSDDTKAMIQCLQVLGIKISFLEDSIEVIGSIHDVKDNNYVLDADLSGTTIRFILPLLSLVPGVKILKGKEELNKRPIKILVDALRQLGAQIDYVDREGYPPLYISSSTLKAGTVTLDGSISSQYFSALLMVAPMIGELIIEVEGVQISKPYIDMTIDTMKKFGINVASKEYRKYIVPEKQYYKIKQYTVEGDFSSAGYFLAIAALTKSTLTLKNLESHSVQADRKILNVLKEMGSKIAYGENEITIRGEGVKAVEVNMIDFPDQAQTLAVLAAFADGTTKLSGIQSLRVKETERVIALENELKKMGIKTSSSPDQLIIYGGGPKPAMINTYGDHRMAMSFAAAGAKLAGMEINDPDIVSKTFPDFWEKINSISIKTEQVNTRNIVLIGMRGSGKTTVAKLLSRELNREYLELDEILVEKTGMSIPAMLEKHGWDYFRDQESAITEEVSLLENKIISTGGGVVTRSKNIKALKKNGVLILLNASVDVLLDRIGDDSDRPSLTKKKTIKEEIKEILKQRRILYEEAANQIINTDKFSPDEIVNQILLKTKVINI
jgi:3-phosphoshikimate 1-carboxyvinyltransferase